MSAQPICMQVQSTFLHWPIQRATCINHSGQWIEVNLKCCYKSIVKTFYSEPDKAKNEKRFKRIMYKNIFEIFVIC